MFIITNRTRFNFIAQLKIAESIPNILFKYLLVLYKAITLKPAAEAMHVTEVQLCKWRISTVF